MKTNLPQNLQKMIEGEQIDFVVVNGRVVGREANNSKKVKSLYINFLFILVTMTATLKSLHFYAKTLNEKFDLEFLLKNLGYSSLLLAMFLFVIAIFIVKLLNFFCQKKYIIGLKKEIIFYETNAISFFDRYSVILYSLISSFAMTEVKNKSKIFLKTVFLDLNSGIFDLNKTAFNNYYFRKKIENDAKKHFPRIITKKVKSDLIANLFNEQIIVLSDDESSVKEIVKQRIQENKINNQ